MRTGRASIAFLAALALTALLTSGCGVPTDTEAKGVPENEIPAALRPVDSVSSKPPIRDEAVFVWFVREDRLVRTSHRIASPTTPANVVGELLNGPSDADRERKLRSAIPDPTAIVAVIVTRGVAAIDLSQTFSEIPVADQVLAVGQLVLTLTDQRGIGRVRFTVGGQDVAVPLPGDTTTTESVSRDDFIDLTSTDG